MKVMDFLDTLLLDPDTTIRDVHERLANQNSLLEMNQETYALHIPCADGEYIMNRHHRTMALEAVRGADVDVGTIYYDKASGYKAARYPPDARIYREYGDPCKLERTAALTKRSHSLQKRVGADLEPIRRLQGYRNRLRQPLYGLTSYEDAIQAVYHLNNPHILCHNDWMDGNILFTRDKTHLTDCEYAVNNDPLFDMMSFLNESQIEDPAPRERFYAVYFGEVDVTVCRRLDI